MTKGLISVVVPSRNEPYLFNTIKDVLEKSKGDIEVIAVLDGWWPPAEEIIDDPRVIYLHRGESRGMRNGINSAVAISKGEYIMKTDAHVMFGEGFDEILKEELNDKTIVIPRRYPLDPKTWSIEKRNDNKYPIDKMYLSTDLHGVPWLEGNTDALIEETPSSQGSVWMMKKIYFHELELLDEDSYGTFYNEFQEIGLKCWLSGGRVIVNKKTWIAHWHKPKEHGRGYSLSKTDQEKALSYLEKWKTGKGWHKQIHPFSWFGEKFPNMPGWSKVK